MRSLFAFATLAGAAAVYKEPARQPGYQPDHVADEMVQPTAYRGAFSTHSSGPSEALRKRQFANACDLSFTDPASYDASGATIFLDDFLVDNGVEDWLQAMNVATTQGFQPTPINCGDLQSDLCTPGTICKQFTPPAFFLIRLAASNAQAFFRNLQEVMQNTIIADGLRIDQVVVDFGPGSEPIPDGGSVLLMNILALIAPALSMGDKVVKQNKDLGFVADGMGFVGGALTFTRSIDTLLKVVKDGPPSIADVTLIANNMLADVFTGAQANLAALNSKLMGGSPAIDIDLSQMVSILRPRTGLARDDSLQDISKIFRSGFFLLPLADILNVEFNSSLAVGIAAGFQLIKQQTVMAILAAQGYFVFVDTTRNQDDCGGIVGARFIDGQCFTLEKRLENFDRCGLDSFVMDAATVSKLDDGSLPYNINLNDFYLNVKACNNGQQDQSFSIRNDDPFPACAFGIPFATAANSVCSASNFSPFPEVMKLPCKPKAACLAILQPGLCERTLLLIANAEENWYPAERCRREAEDVYLMAQRLTTPEDEVALATLRALRENLDTVAASQQREAPSKVDERFLVPGFDPENMDMEWESGEEEEKDMAVGASATGAEGVAASWESFE
ncbi:hypothetical protein LTR56_016852 [Elasticomyces elasticus]|nr:hypothetical protein LTR56_016852 [Elasticomyces elasticus]KAK3666662.1 hypothetical protein LTR22_002611 [Elasticomyces elasticus]KAK4921645.1 hypothetical protein LTR49_010931 [Elasticomyces elasticus]KAK5758589.1 hypothetical protein LTS12_011288 [Elasticomyces elasticus]